MRAINHALTGSLIGLTIGEPLVAMPLALVSHFVCDAIPHYADINPTSIKWIGSKRFLNALIIDSVLCVSLVILLAFKQPLHWQLAAVCAFLAASPDLLNIRLFTAARAKRKLPINKLLKVTIGLQWFQRPIGFIVEIAWFAGAVVLIIPFLR